MSKSANVVKVEYISQHSFFLGGKQVIYLKKLLTLSYFWKKEWKVVTLCVLSHFVALVYRLPLLLPAVFLNIGICVSAAESVDQLSHRRGGHSKAACSMSIRTQLSFEARGCQGTRLIKPHWDQRKPYQLMQMHSGLDSFSSRVVSAHKHGNYEYSLHYGGRTEVQNKIILCWKNDNKW